MGIKYKKVWEDLFDQLSKTILVMLSIALGVFTLSIIFNTYYITDREMTESYLATNPASFIITLDNPDDNVADLLGEHPDIRQAEERHSAIAQICSPTSEYKKCKLYVIDDWNRIQVSTITTKTGKDKPDVGEILLESSSTSVIDATLNNNVFIQLPGYERTSLKVVGTVQANGTNPAWMHEEVLGYISRDTMMNYFPNWKQCDYFITTPSGDYSHGYIKEFSLSIKNTLEKKGYQITSINIPEPGVHPNAPQMNSIILLFRVFGVLATLLSTILVYSTITAILKGQVRQIAVMKAMGATTGQIMKMYYSYVLMLGICAAVLSIPTAKAIANSISAFTAEILIFTINDFSVPIWLYLLEILIATGIPVLAATIPICKGCMAPVATGLREQASIGTTYSNTLQRLIDRISHGKASISLGLRNTFRNKEKLFLSILTLALGGAILMASINIRSSLEQTIDKSIEELNTDIQFNLCGDYTKEKLATTLDCIKEIDTMRLSSSTYATLFDQGENGNSTIQYDASMPITVVSIKYKEGTKPMVVNKNTEAALKSKDIDILSAITIQTAESTYNKHLLTIATFLIGASVLVILVGTISLISLASISVLGRYKEIGVIRTFGGKTSSLYFCVFIENQLTGFLGILAAVALSIPLSSVIGRQFGLILLEKPLPNVISIAGIAIWFFMTLLINAFVSLIVLNKAVRIPIAKLLMGQQA